MQRELELQLKDLPRKEIARKSLDNYGAIVVMDSYIEAAEWINEIAPEHLEIFSSIPIATIDRIRNAGSIFYGDYTPEAVGDYFAGSNHVLPTGGTARFFSPLLACIISSGRPASSDIRRKNCPARGNPSMRWRGPRAWMPTPVP